MFRILSCIVCSMTLSLVAAVSLGEEFVLETPREIPVARDVDVVVVGGSGAAVEAACEAARRGARVFLLAPRPYLGDDICSTLRLWPEQGEEPKSKLARACFGPGRMATPLTVKTQMDKALLEAGVHYLTGCYATDVLRDKQGRLAGIVMASRSGRQAVRAKVIVDATCQALVARQAGAAFRPFLPGPRTFTRVVVGGEMRGGKTFSARKADFALDFVTNKVKERLPFYEYKLTIDMPDRGVASFARAENLARDMTYTRESKMGAEVLSYVPSDTMLGQSRLESYSGAETTDLGAFRPKSMAQLYVLSACADLGGGVAANVLRPLTMMEIGARIGRVAAEEAERLPAPQSAALPAMEVGAHVPGTVGERLDGVGASKPGTIHAGRRALPVLGRYDVVVVGGGTSGAPAGIASAKSGVKTLVLEYLHELGGVGTAGLITSYWHGVRNGYTAYVDKQVNPGKIAWDPNTKAEWLRQELTRHGADVWFGVLACGALVHESQVRGVVVATAQGRGVVLASTVIDASGNADVAACAGAQTQYGISDKGALNVQIAGFPQRPLGQS